MLAVVLMAHGADANARDAKGLVPLHYSVRAGRHDVTCCLVEAGADLNAASDDGLAWTPLHLAASLGRMEDTTVLAEEGARTEAMDTRGR